MYIPGTELYEASSHTISFAGPNGTNVADGHARIGLPHAFSNMGRALSNIYRQFNSEHSNGRMSDPVTHDTLRW